VERADAIHTTSEVEARHLESFGWKLPKVVTIPHGVDDPPGTTEGSRLSDDVARVISGTEPYVLGLGRISWEKGFNRLVDAMPRAPGVRVVIAGGDAGQAKALLEQAKALGVAERTTVIARHVDGVDKEALFAHARAFAMTSLSENFGLAAFEAMRRGLPVVAVPDVGMSEIVGAADAGLVVAANPDSIGGALKRLADDKAGARAMGERGRERVVARYGWSAVADRMEDVYRAAIEDKGRGVRS
jgi:glycosyltransferase involved in cell wall biosynthesis